MINSPERVIKSYGMSLTIWDHSISIITVNRHPTQVNSARLTQQDRSVLDLPTPEGWKAELK